MLDSTSSFKAGLILLPNFRSGQIPNVEKCPLSFLQRLPEWFPLVFPALYRPRVPLPS